MALPSTASYSTPFAKIIQVIVARVATSLGIAPAFNHVVANDKYEVTETEDLFVYTRPYGPSPVDGQGNPLADQGAGRLGVIVSRRIRLYIYTRSGVDVYGDDTIALEGVDSSQTIATPPVVPGQFIAEELVLNSLQNWTPLNDLGTLALTLGPLHWLNSTDGPPERAAENDEGLVRSHLDFDCVYIACINPVEPPV